MPVHRNIMPRRSPVTRTSLRPFGITPQMKDFISVCFLIFTFILLLDPFNLDFLLVDNLKLKFIIFLIA